jgi:hypothetical protein
MVYLKLARVSKAGIEGEVRMLIVDAVEIGNGDKILTFVCCYSHISSSSLVFFQLFLFENST